MNATRVKHLMRKVTADPGAAFRMAVKRATLAADLRNGKGVSSAPRVLALKLTDNCNLRCAMCDQFGPTGSSKTRKVRRQIMPFEAIDRLLQEVARFKPSIYLTGGEPMLHKDVIEIVETVTRCHRLPCEINTNGVLVGRYARELVERCKIDVVTISVHGSDSVSNDAVVGVKGSFDKMVASIFALREVRKTIKSRRPMIRINCVITPETHDHMEDMACFAERSGVDQLNFQHPIYTTPGIMAKHQAVFEPAFDTASPGLAGYLNSANGLDPGSIMSQLEILRSRRWELPVTFYPKVRLEETIAYYTEPLHRFRRESCIAPWMKASVLPNGDVTPCLDLIVGNAFRDGFAAIWNGDLFRAFRRAVAERGLFPGCARCCHRLYE